MKLLNLIFLLFLFSIAATAQTSLPRYPDAPDVKVIDNSWHTKVRSSQIAATAPRPNDSLEDRKQAIRDLEDRNETSVDRHREQIFTPSPFRIGSARQTLIIVDCVFEATVTNTGAKNIRQLVWDYVFLDPSTGREAGYRPFLSKVNISPGKSAKLSGIVSLAQANNANAAKVGKDSRGKYTERVFIRRIEYDDNTVWERPSK